MRPITGWILALALLPSTLPAAVAPVDEPAGSGISAVPGPREGAIPYVVITERRLQGAFMPLVQARTHGGLRAAVVTLEEIETEFPAGVDLAERIRMFLQHAHTNLGTQWVLLGGDDSVIPMRRARLWNVAFAPFLDLPTDQYYACLGGNWNADGDAHWGEGPHAGEPGDNPDLLPELYIGRAPARTAAEVAAFVRRTFAYEDRFASAAPRTALLAADVIGDLIDGAETTERLRPALELDPDRGIVRLYENAAAWPGSLQESRATLLAALDGGFDLAVIVGSGGPGILVAGDEPADYVMSDDLLALTNAPQYPIVFLLSAFTTSPDAPPSIGTALMQARRGGAAAVLGTPHTQFVSTGDQFGLRFFEEALGPDTPIGAALARTITAMHTLSTADFGRLTTQGYVIFGDPALRIDPSSTAAALAGLRRAAPAGRAQHLRVDDVPAAAPGGLAALLTATMGAMTGATLAVDGAAGSASAGRAPEAAALVPRSESARASLEILTAGSVRSQASLRFGLPDAAGGTRYELAVFDLLGRRVRALAAGSATPGRHEVAWDLRSDAGAAVPDGVYFVRLRFADGQLTRRLAVLK